MDTDHTLAPPAVPLTVPSGGTPPPTDDTAGLTRAIDMLAAGSGPVAVDAERASGYRYSSRAYLVQLKRAGSDTVLLDPLPFGDLSALAAVIADDEWVLHAASQDLPCLSEIGLRPTRLFDTEMAARLAGFERVGLAALTESLLGFSLEKHHSAADWSTRPLPESWLTYAALDVELLVELRNLLAVELATQGKAQWAAEEFNALVTHGGAAPRVRTDPWRRTSGIHRVRGARALSRVRAMWYARDAVAARRDAAPGRVLADAAVIAAAEMDPRDERSLLLLPGFGGRSVRRLAGTWLAALDDARALPNDQLPVPVANDGPPPAHRWAERDPVAAARLARARGAVNAIAAEHRLPPENLITPDTVRRVMWEPPADPTIAAIGAALRSHGAREWQIALVADAIADALLES
ncbi:MAG TPA: HRDC domain-containing protein [Micromonosporaceae bacterium]|nr:HRDC domain-containing protein [Micromonosporaceae bacterium]